MITIPSLIGFSIHSLVFILAFLFPVAVLVFLIAWLFRTGFSWKRLGLTILLPLLCGIFVWGYIFLVFGGVWAFGGAIGAIASIVL